MNHQVVELRIWQVPTRHIPAALGHMGRDRLPLNRVPGLEFHKLLGTGSGQTFTMADADLHHWAMLTAFDSGEAADSFTDSPLLRRWDSIASETLTIRMCALSARGRWAGKEPFAADSSQRWRGPVAALTRGRIRLGQWRRFWSAVPPVALDLRGRSGLIVSLGIGEAPVGLQGTFSLWRSGTDLSAFAHRGAAHQRVIAETARQDWYAEELFARFAVHSAVGTFDGREVLLPTDVGGSSQ